MFEENRNTIEDLKNGYPHLGTLFDEKNMRAEIKDIKVDLLSLKC